MSCRGRRQERGARDPPSPVPEQRQGWHPSLAVPGLFVSWSSCAGDADTAVPGTGRRLQAGADLARVGQHCSKAGPRPREPQMNPRDPSLLFPWGGRGTATAIPAPSLTPHRNEVPFPTRLCPPRSLPARTAHLPSPAAAGASASGTALISSAGKGLSGAASSDGCFCCLPGNLGTRHFHDGRRMSPRKRRLPGFHCHREG